MRTASALVGPLAQPVPRAGLPARLRHLGPPLAIFAGSRALIGVALLFALRLPGAGGPARFLAAWDGAWYLRVAQHGYPHALAAAPGQSDLAFFPLYPLLIRGVHAVTGLPWAASAVALNVVASALAMVLIYLLIERLSDARSALRAVTLICLFPWAFVFSMAYAEGLLLVLVATCLVALLDERWVVAGLAALAAGAARPNGFVLVLPCAWAAFVALRRTRSLRPLVAPLLAPWGFLGFFLFLQYRTGDFLANLHARERGWATNGFQFHSAQLARVWALGLNRTVTLAALVLVVGGLVLMARWRPPAIIWLYTVPVLALAVYYNRYASTARFVLTAFPLVAALARPLRGWAFPAVVGISAALMVAVFCFLGTATWFVP